MSKKENEQTPKEIKNKLFEGKKKEFDEIIELAKRIVWTDDYKKYREEFIKMRDDWIELMMSFTHVDVNVRDAVREKTFAQLHILNLILTKPEADAKKRV